MKQKLFTFFLALVASVSAIYASDTQVDGIWYDFDSSTKTASVTYRGSYYGSYNGEYSGSVVIPSSVTYNGTTYSVTSIGNYAFYGCSSLTSITIPESMTSIGDGAFYDCSSLTSVTIPNSVTSIGDWAFSECSSLTSVTIPNSVTSIGDGAFDGCSSISSPVYNAHCFAYMPTSYSGAYTIPEGIEQIAGRAFFYCSKLTSVTIPNSVTSIGEQAFASCSSLTSVIIPNSVTSIGDWAFDGCSKLTSVTIPNSVTSIGEQAFASCSSLTSVIIPESVTSIGNSTFAKCSSLTSITIPNSVTSIGNSAFSYCSSLTSVTIPNSVTSIGDGAFYGCSKLTSVTILGSVTSIGEMTFYECSSLTSITIPNSVTSIGNSAFFYCSSLTSVTIPNSVTSIGDYAFYKCSSLNKTNYTGDIAGWCNIMFGSNYANPMYYSHNFYINDQEIKDLVIPNSVTSIGDRAFYNCSSLTSITCEAETPPTLGSYIFYGVSKSIPVYVPCGCVEAYKAASGWSDFTNIQVPLAAEYSIEVYVNDTIMGTAKVNYNTFCEGAQISATPNFGYHFVQWSDGNTDNPHTLELTQDTTLTAEFAINQYTITTVSSDTQRGTTKGDTTVNYLEYITISATASYGYHFTQWNDANVENPRQVQVTGDATYIATFDKNTYAISLSCNEEQGSVEGVTSAEYLDTVTISATPNIGYHFVQWSDGITDNPRTLELTQDTILIAEFAQSFSGQCGDNLYWSYDETAKTVSITGSGKMYDYTADTQPWFLFKEQIVEVTTNNTVTSIGTSAFEGCVRLAKISLGTGLEEIAAYAFGGCTRLYDIYTYATYPPFAEESSFANYNVYVYVPCEYQRDYTLDIVWGKFKFIECIDSEDATTDGNVTVAPGYNDVTITWPTAENADTYSLVINKDNQPFCTLTFNQEGQLLNIAFAPSRDGNNRPAQYAEQAVNGYRFTVTGLTEATQYAYNITTKDAANKTIATYSGEFTTMGGTTTAVEDILQNTTNVQKLLRNGQLIIVRDGVEYNAMGQEM